MNKKSTLLLSTLLLISTSFAASPDSEIEAFIKSFEDLGSTTSATSVATTPSTSTTSSTNSPTTSANSVRGYNASSSIQVTNTTQSSATLKAPAVTDAVKYSIIYHTSPIQFADPVALKEQVVSSPANVGGFVTLPLSGLTPNTTYYAVVTPINAKNVQGDNSKEFSFKTLAEIKAHSAASVDLNMANVNVNFEGNSFTITWSPLDGVSTVQVYLRHESEAEYKKIADVNMGLGQYTISVTRPGNYYAKLIPLDAANNPVGAEYIKKIPFQMVNAAADLREAPATGPATNVAIALAVALTFFYLYIRYRKINKAEK